jgi:hypothetical protein
LEFPIISNYNYIFDKGYIVLDGVLESIALRGAHEDPASILTLNFPKSLSGALGGFPYTDIKCCTCKRKKKKETQTQ